MAASKTIEKVLTEIQRKEESGIQTYRIGSSPQIIESPTEYSGNFQFDNLEEFLSLGYAVDLIELVPTATYTDPTGTLPTASSLVTRFIFRSRMNNYYLYSIYDVDTANTADIEKFSKAIHHTENMKYTIKSIAKVAMPNDNTYAALKVTYGVSSDELELSPYTTNRYLIMRQLVRATDSTDWTPDYYDVVGTYRYYKDGSGKRIITRAN